MILTVYENQFNAGWQDGKLEGKSLGLAEGETRGSHQKTLETAQILKRFGDSVQKIMQVTGLSKEEVENAFRFATNLFLFLDC